MNKTRRLRLCGCGLPAALGLAAMLLAACGNQAQQSPFGGGLAGKGDNGDMFQAVTLQNNGEYIEIPVDGLFNLTLELTGPAAAPGGGWLCASCDPATLQAEVISQPSEGIGIYSMVLNTTGVDEDYAGKDFVLAFEFRPDPTQAPTEYFSFTLSIAADQVRSDAYLHHACKLLRDAQQQIDPDAPALLGGFIPDEGIRAQLAAACDERDANGRTPPPGCSGVKPPDRGPFHKRIALTFDDGPVPGATDVVLQILEDEGVKGTFFFNGKSAKSTKAKDLLADIVAKGHLVANHTHSHVNSAEQNDSTFFANQVEPTDTLLKQAFVQAGLPLPQIKFFRFPYGATTCSINQVVQDNGYQVVGWHIDTADWCFNSSKEGYGYCSPKTFKWVPDGFRNDFVGYTVSQANKHGGGILLMHDIHKFTRENLRTLIQTLKAPPNNFEFVRLDDANSYPLLNDGIGVTYDGQPPPPPPPPASPFTGDSCSNKIGKPGSDPQGQSWQDYSVYACVDKYHDAYAQTGCQGSLKAGYCPGAANILCCAK